LITDVDLAPQFCCNYFSGRVFTNRPDITSAIGAFVVGILGGLYAKLSRGSAFVIMVRLSPRLALPLTALAYTTLFCLLAILQVAGILFQLPSGLSNGGLLKFAAETTSTDDNTKKEAYSSGFQVAQQLVRPAALHASSAQNADALPASLLQIQVAIGLTVGLFTSAAIVNLLGGGRRRGANLSSF
jgi:uncharacterized membrane protein YjjB (DUF3815 family)